ncbi:MAG: serine hydrolase [Chitinophagales bacterium]|jgi:beta-glucosidase-like glycosyl hydrolase/CubicO group peptidase (beta-lactamase class C family)|nr:serine hydrolase [Chitinophagales bacterium]
MKFRLFIIFWGFVVLIKAQNPFDFSSKDSLWASQILSKLNLNEKIGQLYMPEVYFQHDKKEWLDKAKKLVKKQKVGGFIVMKSDYELAKKHIAELQSMSKTPLWISIDGEWGANMRISSRPKFPYQIGLGALRDLSQINLMGNMIASELREMGIHINFAPVVDINNNPQNPVIGFRSFGEDKNAVTQCALAYIEGMQEYGVMGSIKHFPGHGDTDKDSHHELPYIPKSRADLDSFELYPFREILNKAWSVMVGHMKIPDLDPINPTSLSTNVVNGLLKKELNYQGIVFSDALNMKGSGDKSPGEIELMAYKAGVEVLLIPRDIEVSMKKIEDYVTSSDEAYEALDQRVFKILLFKSKLLNYRQADNISFTEDEIKASIELLYENSLTLVKPKDFDVSAFRLNNTINCIEVGTGNRILSSGIKFDKLITLGDNPTESEVNQAVMSVKSSAYPTVVVWKNLSQYASKKFGLLEPHQSLIKKLSEQPRVLHVWLGNPFGLKDFPSQQNILIAYENNTFTHEVVRNWFAGIIEAEGKLPISIAGYENGYIKKNDQSIDIKLSQLDIKKKLDQYIDEIPEKFIAPGGRVMAYHGDQLIYDKSFGHVTYSKYAETVNSETYYDLASLTKILSTTAVAMKLFDLQKLDLSARVSDYLALDDSTTIDNIQIFELLTHTAGLTPFIPFYKGFDESNFSEYFSFEPYPNFTNQVAQNLYVRNDFKDSMWHLMSHYPLKTRGNYVYSDLSMYILQKVLEKIGGAPIDSMADKFFYKPLNLGLRYNPYKSLPLKQIAPTEDDKYFRRTLVHGFVHDQGACLYGGVAGHAGLFGRASDVATMMRLFLNKGKIQNKVFLSPKTVDLFTTRFSRIHRRGLGFDMHWAENPDKSPCSPVVSHKTFGHTGFTGTAAWADPENNLVYIFLSNRVNPSAENKKLIRSNTRTEIQSMVYELLKATKQ